MKITMEKLLAAHTWVSESTRSVITSDETWEDGVGEVVHGFHAKEWMPEAEFREAMATGNPGNYILEHCPADGTLARGRLSRMGVGEALEAVNGGGWEQAGPMMGENL